MKHGERRSASDIRHSAFDRNTEEFIPRGEGRLNQGGSHADDCGSQR